MSHPPLVFNNPNVFQSRSQKHLAFEEHYKTVLSKTNRTIGLLCKPQNVLPRKALMNFYKAFVRPHLDYGDVLFDQEFKALSHAKLESIKYNACFTLT